MRRPLIPEGVVSEGSVGNATGVATNNSDETAAELLDAEETLKHLLSRDVGQKYWIRWIAVIMATLALLGMAMLLAHLVHSVSADGVIALAPAFAVAIVVAPITSTTVITVALIIGAFGRFEKKHIDTPTSGAVSLVRAVSG